MNLSSGNSQWTDLRNILRHGAFVRYMTGETISMTGTWMQVMAQNWIMTTLTTSAAMLGLVSFIGMIPMIVLSMAGGVAADRFDRRHILLITQVVQIIFAVLLGWLVGAQLIAIWHVMAVAFILGISNAFEMPAASALVPELVPKNQIALAIAIDRSVFHSTRMVGPALAGWVIGVWGSSAAFYLNAFSFLAIIVALYTITPRPPGTADEEKQRRSGLKEGFDYVRSDKPTMAMIGLMASTTFFVFPIMAVMLPLYAKVELHLGPDKMGMLMGISGMGSLTGTLTLLALPRHLRQRLIIVAIVAVFVALLGLSRAHQFAYALMALILMALGVSSLFGLANTIVQERAPTPLRGRVSAIAGLSFFGLLPFASLGITTLADWIGMRPILVISATLYSIIAAIILVVAEPRLNEPLPNELPV
jgi:MFS family permease